MNRIRAGHVLLRLLVILADTIGHMDCLVQEQGAGHVDIAWHFWGKIQIASHAIMHAPYSSGEEISQQSWLDDSCLLALVLPPILLFAITARHFYFDCQVITAVFEQPVPKNCFGLGKKKIFFWCLPCFVWHFRIRDPYKWRKEEWLW